MKRLWWALVAVLSIAAVAAVSFAVVQTSKPTETVADSLEERQGVVHFVEAALPPLLSYDAATGDATLTEARDRFATGALRDDFRTQISQLVPTTLEPSVTSEATVSNVGIEALAETSAVALAAVDQVITSPTAEFHKLASSIRLALERVDDGWLIAEFTVVGSEWVKLVPSDDEPA